MWLTWLLAGSAIVTGGEAIQVGIDQVLPNTGLVAILMVLGVWLVIRFFWILGLQARHRRSGYRALQEQAELAGVVERTRIARETHGIVAHNLSGVIALTDGARFAAAKEPGAVETLVTISDTSREALQQMRRLLSVLRDDSGREIQAAPGDR